MGIPGEDSKQGIKNLFDEIITENFPNMMMEKHTQAQEAQSPKQVGPKEAHTETHHR